MVEVVYTDEFERWWDGLSVRAQRDVAVVVEMLRDRGVALGFPQSSAIKGSKLRELRVQSRGRPLRVFYAFGLERAAVLLLGGDKTGRDRLRNGRGETARGRREMRIHRWEDLKRKAFTPKQLAEIERRAKKDLLEADLREMRKLLGVTQVQLAKRLRASQGHVSETERREDLRLSTLRKYVQALGGELEVIANFGDRRIRLHGA